MYPDGRNQTAAARSDPAAGSSAPPAPPSPDQIMGPKDLEDTIEDLEILSGKKEGQTFSIGRNGAKREITEREILEKYIERKTQQGEFIETMKVTYAHRRGAVARGSVGNPPRETDAHGTRPRFAHPGPR